MGLCIVATSLEGMVMNIVRALKPTNEKKQAMDEMPRVWRVRMSFTDGTNIIVWVPVEYWDYWPILEVIEAAQEFHGIYDDYMIGIQIDRYEHGVKVR